MDFVQSSDMDEMLVHSLSNCPMCAGSEGCLRHCHLDEGKPWGDCLNSCMSDNPLVANAIYTMAKRASESKAGRVGQNIDTDDDLEET